jgi:hypothetical protein
MVMAQPMLYGGYDDVKTVNEHLRHGAAADVWADEIHCSLLRVAEAPHRAIRFGPGAPAYSCSPSGLIKHAPRPDLQEGFSVVDLENSVAPHFPTSPSSAHAPISFVDQRVPCRRSPALLSEAELLLVATDDTIKPVECQHLPLGQLLLGKRAVRVEHFGVPVELKLTTDEDDAGMVRNIPIKTPRGVAAGGACLKAGLIC